jgi:hypothetical protein
MEGMACRLMARCKVVYSRNVQVDERPLVEGGHTPLGGVGPTSEQEDDNDDDAQQQQQQPSAQDDDDDGAQQQQQQLEGTKAS